MLGRIPPSPDVTISENTIRKIRHKSSPIINDEKVLNSDKISCRMLTDLILIFKYLAQRHTEV